MRPPRCLIFALMLALSISAMASVFGQTEPEEETREVSTRSIPLTLDISRRSLKNFLQDETALEPYRRPDGSLDDLEGAFTMGAIQGRYALIWDPHSCRLAGVLDVKPPETPQPPPGPDGIEGAPSPYVLMAEGFSPLTGSLGTFGYPVYFGFRLMEGQPEFLYSHGSLQVEERLWLEDDGSVLKQRFSVKDPENAILLRFPQSWKARIVDTSAGTWSNETLSVPVENAGEVIVTYRLGETIDPEESN